MKFCTNCGNQLENEKFCPKCGTPAQEVGYVSSPNNINRKKANHKIIPTVIIIVLIAAMAVGAFALFGGRSCESLIKNYVEASITGDVKKMMSLMPDSLIEYIAEEEYDGDKDDMLSDLEDGLSGLYEQLEKYGVDISTVSYEIVDVEDMTDEDIEDIEDDYSEAKLKIKDGKELKIELKIPIDGQERTNSIYVDAVKIGRSWYLIDF